jgi:hypothetical protein
MRLDGAPVAEVLFWPPAPMLNMLPPAGGGD